jgi:hypothetical protein
MLNEGINIMSKEVKGVLGIFIIFLLMLFGYYLLAKYDLL